MPIPQLSQNKYQQSWKDRQNTSSRTPSRNPNKNNKPFWKRLFFSKKTLLFLIVAGIVFILSGLGVVAWMSRDLPDPNQLMDRDVAQSTKIFDRTGETLLYEIHGQQQRTLKTLEEIPNYAEHATIAMEDKNFYKHSGFSLWAIFRTAITDIVYGKMAGASTITQQLVKNAVLTPEKTFTRKIKELILAYQIEQKYSKDEILQMYLNEIPYGGTAYGIEAASQHYFGKKVEDISLAEAATLASLPKAPSYYSPYGPHKDLLLQRKDYILKLMEEQGYISEKEKKEAQNQELDFKEPSSNIKAPHFVMYIKSILAQKYGQKMLEQGGLKIHTSLDMYKQKLAEQAVQDRMETNEEKYQATNAGLVSLDPKTGQILAMVGSRDYFSDNIEGAFNVTTAKRQPGSSMKPIVYSSLFNKGFTPQTKLFDVVTNFSNNSDPYEPKNYDLKEHGLISIRKALAGSLNIPAVKSLYLAGMDNVFELTQQLGYSTFSDRSRFGLSLVLGGGEVKLLEHTNAYSAFAREGVVHPISPVLKIENSQGEVIEEYQKRERRVLKSGVARMINSILSDNQARAYTYGLDNWLTLENRPVAAKTGTTNSYRDAWTIGYTPSLVTGVWVGNNDNSKMKRGASGGNVAAPIWNKYMQTVLGDTPVETFRELGDIKTGKPAIDGNLDFEKTVKIDKASGLLATEHTPEEYIKEVSYKTQPHSILYYVNKKNPLGSKPKDPSQDPQFKNWEKAVQRYARESEEYKTGSTSVSIPTKYDNVHQPALRPDLEILSPNNKETLQDEELEVKIKTSAPRGVDKAVYYINGQLLEQIDSYPFDLEYDIDFLSNGYHELGVEICDDVGNCTRKNIIINLKLKDNSVSDQNMDISWLSPSNGVIVNRVDFPINLEVNINPLKKISKAEMITTLVSATSSPQQKLNSWYSIRNNNLNFDWDRPKQTGTYEIVLKVHTWEGDIKTSQPLTINVNKQ